MKKNLHTLMLLLTLPFLSLKSQVMTTTYSTGFDNAAQQAGWVEYRKGDTGVYEFNMGVSNAFSGTQCMYHNYPVGGSQETIDWYVFSIALDFSAGGKIDSVRCNFGGFGTPATDDTVAIFLLKGSPDPAMATAKTLLFDFRGADYMNDAVWRKFSNINVPATAGQSYIGFKYRTIINWLDVKFDNLTVSASHSTTATGIVTAAGNAAAITLFPNPVEKNMNVSLRSNTLGNEKISIKLFNILGEPVLEKNISDEKQLRIDQPAGTYIYQVINANGSVIKAGKLVVQ